MRICEIYAAIQGEGRNLGVPSLFIRFSGCNLACKWCDTKYHIEGIQMSLEDVLAEINKYKELKNIVFTGGEPALYLDEIKDIINRVKCYNFEIESNGSIEIPAGLFKQVNISYKLKNSGVKEYELKAISDSFDYKFVVQDKNDIKEINEFIDKYKIPKESVYLMPEGFTRERQLDITPKIMNLCLKYNFKLTPRLHILIFNKQRKV